MKRSLDTTPSATSWHDLPLEVQRLCVVAAPRPLWQCVSRQWYRWISAEQLPWWDLLPLPPWDDDAVWEHIVLARAGPHSEKVPRAFLDKLHRLRCQMAVYDASDTVMRNLAHYVWDLKPLACVNWSPRDMYVTFEERGHRYVIMQFDRVAMRYSLHTNVEGSPGAYTSVTTLHKPLFEQFDALAQSERCAGKGAYAGMSAEQVRAQWSANGAAKSGRGTLAHARIEDDMNGWTCSLHDNDAPPFEIYREFVRDHIAPCGLRPFRSEMTVYDTDLRLVGQIDALYEYVDEEKRRPRADGLVHLALLADWKCAEKVEREPYRSPWAVRNNKPGKRGIAVCTRDVDDCEYQRWCMQVCRYNVMLRPYWFAVDAMCDVVIHPEPKPPRSPGDTRYQRLDVEMNTTLMQAVSHHRYLQIVQAGARDAPKDAA